MSSLIGKTVKTKWAGGDERSPVAGKVIAYTDKPTVCIEYPDGSREEWIADLVEVVTPPVVLPTEHALGWVKWEQGDTDLGVWSTRMAHPRGRLDGVLVDRTYRSNCWNPEKVTAFTPATAVPTESLAPLRAATGRRIGLGELMAIVEDFLAAVDNANGATS